MIHHDGEQFRPVPGFPNYMVSEAGDFRNVRTGQLISPVMQGNRAHVILFRNGRRYKRAWWKMIEAAWPPREERIDEIFSDWVQLPDFRSYEIDRNGRIRRRSTGRLLAVREDSGEYVQLTRDGVKYKRSIRGLMRSVGYDYRPKSRDFRG